MTTDDQNLEANDPGQLRQMYEAQAAANADLQRQIQTLTTHGLFRDAGLDPQNKQHAAFMRAYDGDTNPEAVRAYVDELGIQASAPSAPPVQAAPPPPQVPESEQAAMMRMAQAAMGGNQPPPQGPSAEEEAWKKIQSLPKYAPQDQVNAAFDEWAVARGGPVSRQTGAPVNDPGNYVTEAKGHPFR